MVDGRLVAAGVLALALPMLLYLEYSAGLGGETAPATTTTQPAASTSTSSSSITTTTTTPLGASTTLLTPQCEEFATTTTSTLPEFVEVQWLNLKDCRSSRLGNLNTLNIRVSGEKATGAWGTSPENPFHYLCDLKGPFPFDRLIKVDSGMLGTGVNVTGLYRASARCGRNQRIMDLEDCGDLKVLLNTSTFHPTSIYNKTVDVDDDFSLDESGGEVESNKSKLNTYLERFRGLGYRKADLHVAWSCPSCVPAVNDLVIGEAGVKSRSLAFNQDVSYVIYDPEVVDLDRILLLCNAGGDVTLLNDTVF